jgi:microcystin degradation protein MlrC
VHRAELFSTPVSVVDAMDKVDQLLQPEKTVILCETSDHGGSGGPNNGTHVLCELLKLDIPQSLLASIFDPEVADQAHSAGVGNRINVRVGGKKDAIHGEPVPLQNVEVLGLSDGHFNYTTPMYLGQPYCIGKTARLRNDNVEFVVCSVPSAQG